MNDFSPNYRELIIALVGEKYSIGNFFGAHEKYKLLINEINKYDLEDDEKLPSQKELFTNLGINRVQLMSLMKGLYQDFITETSHLYPIQKTEVHISGEKRSGEFFQLSLDNMTHIPSAGETIRIPFIRGEFGGGGYFQVKRITHKVEQNTHSIVLFASEDFDVGKLDWD